MNNKTGLDMVRGLLLLLALLLGPLASGQEICDNGIDDDGNGLVDLNDTLACPCTVVPPASNLLANGSFEDHDCCPEGPHQYLQCATGWLNYMVSSTAEYFNCDFVPPNVPQPFPDGNAVAGFGAFTDWDANDSHYEFIMTCLTAPMQEGETHELRFNIAAARVYWPSLAPTFPMNLGPIDLAIYGLATCPTEPYVIMEPVFNMPMPAIYCATEFGWTELGHVTYNPASSWQEVSFTFTPGFDVQAIMFGPTCPVPADYISYQSTWPYFFLDDMHLIPVDLTINSTGHPCTNDLVFTAAPYDGAVNEYQWYLDGVALVGQTGQVLNASALGLGAGVYAVRMIQPNGSCLLAEKEILVQYPEPLINVAPTTGCAPLVVQFNNATDPALNGATQWDLGDGTTSAGNSFLHTYTQPGTYDVAISVTSAQGCTTDSLFEDLITVYPKPVPSFQADTTYGCAGLPVTFTSNTQPAGNYTYTWSFGDGTIGNGNPATHTYANAGTFSVMLIATSEFGCAGEVTMPQLIQTLPAPQPAFNAEPPFGCIPLNVRFNNNSPGQDQQTASWDLGNGTTSTELSPTTSYTQPGTYSVSLTMTNQAGCSTTVTDSAAVTAYEPPVVTFNVEPTEGCAPLPVQFTNTTDPGMIGSCEWAFGDGGSANDCITSHTYTQPGTYTVSLHVVATTGCEGDTTLQQIINVFPNPVAYFGFQPWPAEISDPVITFKDSSSIDVTAWAWTFPGGDPPSGQNSTATVAFPGDAPGVYPVELIVTNAYGCTDTTIRNVPVEGRLTVFVPNAFTPDGDGVNDRFAPVLRDADPRYYTFSIFDRWGAEIFSSSTIGEGWDGTVNGQGPKTDVYTWMLKVKSAINAETRSYYGRVVLLK
ncbi:MAG TPA: PKD domain-containing protein [Flavobacteriales bacterium]|nr:PKD domain-containing protein [Flavobacteriales bacterium]